MKPVKIIADSTCDLTDALKERYDVQIVPLYVTLGQDSFTDGLSVTPGDIYRYFEQTKQTPKTAAATVADFYTVFEPYAKEGRDIVFIGISSKISTTVSQAQLAAREFPNIRIRCVDSQNLSTGIGLSVLAACELAEQSHTADEIAARILAMVPRVRSSFVIDTMTFLYHGGRCSAVQAYGASLLRIKPQISVTDGSMHPSEKFRGGIAHVSRQYAERALENLTDIDPKRVFITYTQDTDEAVVRAVRDVVDSKAYFQEVLQTTAGCVITSHCGRNVIGVLYTLKA